MEKIISLLKERSIFTILYFFHTIFLCVVQYYIYRSFNNFLIVLICGAIISAVIHYVAIKLYKKQSLWQMIDEFLTSSIIVWFIGV